MMRSWRFGALIAFLASTGASSAQVLDRSARQPPAPKMSCEDIARVLAAPAASAADLARRTAHEAMARNQGCPGAIDPAFMRRMAPMVEVPVPKPEERKAIWGSSLPKEAPKDDPIQ